MRKIIFVIFLILNFFLIYTCSKVVPTDPVPTCERVIFQDQNLEEEICKILQKTTCYICKSDCEAITNLVLNDKNITNLQGLQYFKNLTELELSGNNISDITVLSALKNLTYLGLGFNNISDIAALSELTNLTILVLQQNNITNISALSTLKNLTDLNLSNNQIPNIDSLADLLKLNNIYLSNNNIDYITALVINCDKEGLGAGDYVDLEGNPLTHAASDISHLEGKGVSVVY